MGLHKKAQARGPGHTPDLKICIFLIFLKERMTGRPPLNDLKKKIEAMCRLYYLDSCDLRLPENQASPF